MQFSFCFCSRVKYFSLWSPLIVHSSGIVIWLGCYHYRCGFFNSHVGVDPLSLTTKSFGALRLLTSMFV